MERPVSVRQALAVGGRRAAGTVTATAVGAGVREMEVELPCRHLEWSILNRRLAVKHFSTVGQTFLVLRRRKPRRARRIRRSPGSRTRRRLKAVLAQRAPGAAARGGRAPGLLAVTWKRGNLDRRGRAARMLSADRAIGDAGQRRVARSR